LSNSLFAFRDSPVIINQIQTESNVDLHVRAHLFYKLIIAFTLSFYSFSRLLTFKNDIPILHSIDMTVTIATILQISGHLCKTNLPANTACYHYCACTLLFSMTLNDHGRRFLDAIFRTYSYAKFCLTWSLAPSFCDS